ncbi:MAG TPA: 3-deoxy-D-manno-octulosonic acid kinase [Gammaproteobacteria bacterium]|nr:3-deoxy-D-manno-octulosonic acid kinase [Gammaproteobacteria bacterium]
MAERTVTTKRGFILYDDACTRHAHEDLFSPRQWARREALSGTVGGRGQTWIVHGEDGDWVLRHYRRGGLVAHLVSDHYLWSGLERTRAWREWRLLDALYKDGFPVPQPVAAQVTRRGPWYRADLITRLIPDCRSLATALHASRIEALPWQAIGACIRRFHDAGIYHADLNAHNILLDAQGKVYLLDFDRGERRHPGTLWQEANLGRLLRSLRKFIAPSVIESTAWNALLHGYQNGTIPAR